jgi:F0F1-type ATP synthase membrane subunit b/b'
MEEQIQSQPSVEQTPPTVSAKKSNIWLWILGGCLGVVLIIGIIVAGMGWWAARKVKNIIKEGQPKVEEMRKNAEKWQENSRDIQRATEEWQKEMEKSKN